MKGDIISCCYTKLIYICFQIQQTGYDWGGKINDLENMSTETSQTERKNKQQQQQKKTPLQRYTICQLQKTKDEEKNLERKGTRGKKYLNN